MLRRFVANFPAAFSGSPVGYRLDGGTRTTAGVTEAVAGSGSFYVDADVDPTARGVITWDTGGGSPRYVSEEYNPTDAGGSGSGDSGGASVALAPSRLATVYCNDEALAIRRPQDFMSIAPRSQRLVSGSDGHFEAGSPWVLVSASANFAAAGLAVGCVVALTAPKANFGSAGGDLFAVTSADSSSVSLRRLGLADGTGEPPAPGALSSVAFECRTFLPQIEIASYAANQFFGIDPAIGDKAPARLYDPRELEEFTALEALRTAYASCEKAAQSDFKDKLDRVTSSLGDLVSRIKLRWGQLGEAKPPTRATSARLRR